MDREQASSALHEAVKAAGGQSAFGRLIGRNQSTVFDWLRLGKALPAEHVRDAEAATGVSRHRLRPDLYPPSEVPAERTVGTGAPVVACDRGAGMHRSARA